MNEVGKVMVSGYVGAVLGAAIMTLVLGRLHARRRKANADLEEASVQVRQPDPDPVPPMPTVRFRIDPPGVMLRIKELPMRDAQRLAAWFRLQ